MKCYASRTGTLSTIEAMRSAGWGFFLTPSRDLSPPPLPYALDNDAWGAFLRGQDFDMPAFEKALARRGRDADFVVLPDKVAGGMESLEMSVRTMNWVLSETQKVLIAVQDGMEHADLAPLVGPNVGIFLGGSTPWKLARMADWGQFCALHRCHYHVARVNTVKRFRMAHAAGADTIDGTSVVKFPSTLALLEGARRQPDMFAPVHPDDLAA